MNAIHFKRLETLAEILVDASKSKYYTKIFTMRKFGYPSASVVDPAAGTEEFVNTCGTPACSMGHYASRTDRQRKFYLDQDGDLMFRGAKCDDTEAITDHYEDHFGLSSGESYELFESTGCGNAQTPAEAAKYVKAFIKRKRGEMALTA